MRLLLVALLALGLAAFTTPALAQDPVDDDPVETVDDGEVVEEDEEPVAEDEEDVAEEEGAYYDIPDGDYYDLCSEYGGGGDYYDLGGDYYCAPRTPVEDGAPGAGSGGDPDTDAADPLATTPAAVTSQPELGSIVALADTGTEPGVIALIGLAFVAMGAGGRLTLRAAGRSR